METGCEGGHICLSHVEGLKPGCGPGTAAAGVMSSVCVLRFATAFRDTTKIENVELKAAGKVSFYFCCFLFSIQDVLDFKKVPKS